VAAFFIPHSAFFLVLRGPPEAGGAPGRLKVKEPSDAEALALGDADFGAGVRVRQFGAFALVQGAGDLGELFRQFLGDLSGGALWLVRG